MPELRRLVPAYGYDLSLRRSSVSNLRRGRVVRGSVKIVSQVGLAVVVSFVPGQDTEPFFVGPRRLGAGLGGQVRVAEPAQVFQHGLAPVGQIGSDCSEQRNNVVGGAPAGESLHEVVGRG